MKLSRLTIGIMIAGIILVVVIVLVVRNFTTLPQVTLTGTATIGAVLARTDLPVSPVFNRTATSTREVQLRPTQTSSPAATETVAATSSPSPTGLPILTVTPTASVTPLPIATLRPAVLPTSSQITPTTSGLPSSFGFSLLYLTSSTHAGTSAQATIKTAPNATCSISVILPRGAAATAPSLGPMTAGVDGMCSWFWGVPANALQGTGYVTISANGQTQTFVMFIQ